MVNLPCRTTAENMSKLFFNEISALLDEKVKSPSIFECQMDLTLRIPRDLFLMSVQLFILIIVLRKNDVCNLKKIKKI